ncbi:MAG TPA: amidohydrolase, partial [Flavobacteriales bacterium]|nr:amidohydrolase [Flavobacteriales bacterium]
TLSDKRENESVLITDAAQHFSFRKGNSNQAYPSSLMGSIALLTQTYYDAKWYAAQKQLKEENLSLQALNRWHNLPQIFDANDKYNVLRADKIGDQFGVQYVFKTNGKEYQRLNEIKSSKGTLIVPLNFPDPYDVEDTYDAMNVSLEDMKHWELAPYNPSLLHKSQIRFVLTSSDLKEKKQFLPNLRKAVRYGLPEAEALKALTVYPAQLLGVDKQLGTLEKGKVANFIICSEQIFSEKASIQQNWVQGNLFVIQVEDPLDIRGDYDVNIENNIYSLSVKGGLQELQASLKVDTTQVKAKVSLKNRNVSVSFIVKDKNYNGAVRLTGVVHQDGGVWDGNGELPNGNRIKWNAIRKAKFKEENKPSVAPKDSLNQGRVWFPVMAYGWDSLPRQGQVLIKNITVWTNEKEGVLKNTDVLLRDGKIFKIGRILDVVDKSTWVIDGTGKHLTAGIVDEHSHIAISGGVNEGTHAVTAEVNISDVVNSDDVNIYRQLGGGVTAAQLLHGSANPIGGRSDCGCRSRSDARHAVHVGDSTTKRA